MEQVVVLFLGFLFCGLDVGMLCVFFQSMFERKHSSVFFGCACVITTGIIFGVNSFQNFHVKFCNFTIGYVDFYSDYVEAVSQKGIHLYGYFLYCVCMRKGNGI